MRNQVLTIGIGALVASLVAACGADHTGNLDAVGSLNLQLTTQGPDGLTYRIPPGNTWLFVESGSFYQEIDAGVDATEVSVPLPPGTYTINAYGDAHDYPLLRLLSGGTEEPVSSLRLNEFPETVTIVADVQTDYNLRFLVAEVGDVVFEAGTFSVAAEVDLGGPLPAESLFVDMAVATTGENYGETFPDLPSELSLSGLTGLDVEFGLAQQGDWVWQSMGRACRSVEVRQTEAHGASDWQELIYEAAQASGSFCLEDIQGAGQTNFSLSLGGAMEPYHPALMGLVGPGDTLQMQLFISGTLAFSVWDGSTLRLALLEEATNMDYVNASLSIEKVSSGIYEFVYEFSAAGPLGHVQVGL